MTVTVADPGAATLVELMVQVTPAGAPVQVKLTDLLKPPPDSTLTVNMSLAPCNEVWNDGTIVMLKSPGGTAATTNVALLAMPL